MEFQFRDKALDIIDGHDQEGDAPLFLVYSSHLPVCVCTRVHECDVMRLVALPQHYPLMVPEEHLEQDVVGDDENGCAASTDYVFPGFADGEHFECRTMQQSQVNLLDVIVGQLVDKL